MQDHDCHLSEYDGCTACEQNWELSHIRLSDERSNQNDRSIHTEQKNPSAGFVEAIDAQLDEAYACDAIPEGWGGDNLIDLSIDEWKLTAKV